MPAKLARPPRCMPLLRYTSRCGRWMSAVSRYGAITLTGRVCGPPMTPALWMTASIGPRRFTWWAIPRVSSTLDRSPVTAAAPRSIRLRTAVSRSRFRAWTTTWCPCSISVCAAARPRPSAEPVMKTRAIGASLLGLVGRAHGEFVDRRVLGLVDRDRHDVRDPVRGDLVRVVHAFHLLGRVLVADRAQQLGADGGGVDRRGADVGAFHGGLHAEDLHEVANEPLRAAVYRATRIRLETGDRRRRNDVPGLLLDERRQHGRNAVQDAVDVHGNRLMPIVGLQRGQRRVRHDAGVQEDDVNAAKGLLGEPHDGVVVRRFGHVQPLVDGLAAIPLDLFHDLLQLVFASRPEDELGALACEQLCGRFADSG